MQGCKDIFAAARGDSGGLLAGVGRVPAVGDIRLDMGVGRGIDLPCVLGRAVHALFPDLHRHNLGDKTLVGTAEKEIRSKKLRQYTSSCRSFFTSFW